MMPKTAHLDEDPPATDAYEGLAGTLAGNVDATPALRRKIEKGRSTKLIRIQTLPDGRSGLGRKTIPGPGHHVRVGSASSEALTIIMIFLAANDYTGNEGISLRETISV